MAKVRNTPTHRICPTCQGEGNVEERSPTMAPWEDWRIVECDHVGCEDGWVRFRDEDPLEQLKGKRADFVRGWPNRQYAWSRYAGIRQRAVMPVLLPPDGRAYYEAVRDLDSAIRVHRFFRMMHEAQMQRAA